MVVDVTTVDIALELFDFDMFLSLIVTNLDIFSSNENFLEQLFVRHLID